ncbi:MAG: cation diffusion facilitator family transporter [Flavipsychrobacter sp.]|nr:cation diffusion facilitator family transporter [Flavipsychrobacter sp.]
MHDHSHNHSHHNHDDGHGHHHHHVTPADATNKAFIAGIILNSIYVIVQIGAGIYTNSIALLSDAGHNLGDVASLALSLIAFKLAKVKPSGDYTYGYKKTTILASLTNAVILLITIGILGFEAIVRLRNPQPVEGGIVAWVSGLGIIINGISALFFLRNKDHDLNNKGAYLHLLTDAMVSLGVVVAGVIIYFTHWYWLDGVVSLIVLAIILSGTWHLLTDSLKLSMDAVPPGLDVLEIEKKLMNVKGVENIHHVHIWAMSTTENALTTHLVLDKSLTFDEKMKVVHNIKHKLLHENIQHATIELESAEMPCEDDDC